jgi:hypothetical protein
MFSKLFRKVVYFDIPFIVFIQENIQESLDVSGCKGIKTKRKDHQKEVRRRRRRRRRRRSKRGGKNGYLHLSSCIAEDSRDSRPLSSE